MNNKNIIRAMKDSAFRKSLTREDLAQIPDVSTHALTTEELSLVTGATSHSRPLTGMYGLSRSRPLTGFGSD